MVKKGEPAMDVTERVLELLQEARGPVSGEQMAEALGVTRNTVWKAVKRLREAGYVISAVTNQGYRLLSESDVLTPGNIRRRLEPQAALTAIDVRESVTSTNTVLKELAEQGGREGMVVIAHRQTQGKGRLGRSFYSPRGGGLYMSILLRPAFPAEEALSITTAAAVAVARAIDEVTGDRALIKWVNDVYFHGRKVCGILTEASVDFETGGLQYAVLGMGTNLTPPEGGFPPEAAQVAGALFPENAPPGARTQLAAAILNHFFTYYKAMPQRTYMDEYRSRSLLTGMGINFMEGSTQREGTVLGIDSQARLLVKLPNGTQRCFGAGEVNIQRDFLERLRQET